MWKLTIEDDEGKRTPLPLFRDEYTVGRSEENTIRLTERNISRQHALLRRVGLGWALLDYHSRNGSFINGVRVSSEAQLQHGDVVQLGDYRIEVIDESLVEQTSGGSSDSAMAATKPDRLVVVAGPSPGQEFVICAPTMLIGRAAEVDVSIPHISVSRVHAEVHALGNGRYEVIDKGSANGVRVNGSLLGRALIEAGDYIELGEVRLKFVGAGQVYWPGAEATRLSVEAPEISTMRPPAAPSWGPPRGPRDEDGASAGSSLAKNFAIGAVGAVVAVGAMFAYQRFRLTYPRPGAPRPEISALQGAPARSAIEEARDLARSGLVDAAHDKISKELVRDPSVRDSPEVRDIERRWAESVLAKAEQEADPTARRTVLNTVAQNPVVDGDLRRQVADKLRELDERGKDTRDLPHATRPASGGRASETGARNQRERDAVLAADPWAPEKGTDSGRTSGAEPGTRRSRKAAPAD